MESNLITGEECTSLIFKGVSQNKKYKFPVNLTPPDIS